MYLGDFDFGSKVFFRFTTVNSSGVPTALSSAGITAYRDGSTVQDTTGLTLTSNFDAIVGLNMVQVDMSTAGFYSSAGSYTVILSSGAASENLTGYVLGHFSLRDRFVLSTAGLETLSSAGLETVSTIGLETASSNVSVANLSTAAAIEVNTEMLDVVQTDSFTVPLDLPTTAESIVTMLGFQHASLTQQLKTGASHKTFHNPAGGVQWLKPTIDDGTTYVELRGTTST